MTDSLRDDRKTPNGGAYSEIYFFDEQGNATNKKNATRIVIRECAENGDLISETWGNKSACKPLH